jgi:hypothetical protein
LAATRSFRRNDGDIYLRAAEVDIDALPLIAREGLPPALLGKFNLQMWSNGSRVARSRFAAVTMSRICGYFPDGQHRSVFARLAAI